ncbi:hypothetical protein JL107_17590 [Nakamurella flavida]|uniref:Uncharacterized protein n=1 Tax=Nakamurella flavida TaxID=363630 RepID=A0A938YRR7_9ACTN|nr:hypothetical protein [Nakamurella flavida]MBM9478264.1 hypothetical protein [Nakamurella flavida]MDP9777565.1 hypothetical protein [Nakamurella flavida]
MTALLEHPLIAAYLADLDRALAGTDPIERADIVAGVREDLTERLSGGRDPSPDEIRAALGVLGPVDRIAAAATPAPPLTPAPSPAGNPTAGPLLLAGALLGVVLLPTLFPSVAVCLVVLVAALVVRHRRTARHRSLVTAATVVAGLGLLAGAFVLLFLVQASSGPVTTDPVQVGLGLPGVR